MLLLANGMIPSGSTLVVFRRGLRGVDSGADRDPDALYREAMNPGGSSGDSVGSVQSFATAPPSDTDELWTDPLPTGNISSVAVYTTTGPHAPPPEGVGTIVQAVIPTYTTHAHGISNMDDSETRPKNAYVNWIIKF